jgi:hypothetical protein
VNGMNKAQVAKAMKAGNKWGYGYKATDINGETRVCFGRQRTRYVVGTWVKADFLTRDRDEDCGHGIHIGSATFIRDWISGHWAGSFRYFLLKFRLNRDCILPKTVGGKWRVYRAFVVKEIKRP